MPDFSGLDSGIILAGLFAILAALITIIRRNPGDRISMPTLFWIIVIVICIGLVIFRRDNEPPSLPSTITPTLTHTLSVTSESSKSASILTQVFTVFPTPTPKSTDTPIATSTSTVIPTITPTLTATRSPSATWTPLSAYTTTPYPSLVPTLEPSPIVLGCQVRTTDSANIRTGPGTAYQIIGSASINTQLQVVGVASDSSWWQVNYYTSVGWILGRLVNVIGNCDAITVQNLPIRNATATSNGLISTITPTRTISQPFVWSLDCKCTNYDSNVLCPGADIAAGQTIPASSIFRTTNDYSKLYIYTNESQAETNGRVWTYIDRNNQPASIPLCVNGEILALQRDGWDNALPIYR